MVCIIVIAMHTMEAPTIAAAATLCACWGAVGGGRRGRGARSCQRFRAPRGAAVRGHCYPERKFKMVKGGRGGSKKKATSRSAKAGLQFPVGRVHRHIKLGCREEAAAAPRT